MIQEWIVVKLLKRLELVMQAFSDGQGEMASKTINELRSSIMIDDDLEQIRTWNQSTPEAVDKYVHEIVQEAA